MTPAVILAGGRSQRFGGGDKCLARLGDATILDHILKRLRPQAGPIALNANGDPARFAGWEMPVLADDPPDFAGPLAGILAALRWGRSLGVESVLTVPCDTPFLPIDLVARLSAEPRGSQIAFACSSGRQHVATALWPTRLAEALSRDLSDGHRKVLSWIGQNPTVAVAWDGTPDPFFNINTAEELAAAEQRIQLLR